MWLDIYVSSLSLSLSLSLTHTHILSLHLSTYAWWAHHQQLPPSRQCTSSHLLSLSLSLSISPPPTFQNFMKLTSPDTLDFLPLPMTCGFSISRNHLPGNVGWLTMHSLISFNPFTLSSLTLTGRARLSAPSRIRTARRGILNCMPCLGIPHNPSLFVRSFCLILIPYITQWAHHFSWFGSSTCHWISQ